MHNISPNLIEKAKTAKSAEELLEIAKDNGVEMTADEAKTYFAQLNPKSGELDDDALDGVAGGVAIFDEMDFCPLAGDGDGKRVMPSPDVSVVVSASITPNHVNGNIKE